MFTLPWQIFCGQEDHSLLAYDTVLTNNLLLMFRVRQLMKNKLLGELLIIHWLPKDWGITHLPTVNTKSSIIKLSHPRRLWSSTTSWITRPFLKSPIPWYGTAPSSNSQVQEHKQSSQSPDIALAHQVRHLLHEISDQLKKNEENKFTQFNHKRRI
jgi:hypothetical protein